MDLFYKVLVGLHILGVLAIGFAVFSQLHKNGNKIGKGVMHGALLQLVTGVAMVGLRESDKVTSDDALNMGVVGAKLFVVLAILHFAKKGEKQEDQTLTLRIIAGLFVANVILGSMVG